MSLTAELRQRAASYRDGCESAEHTAALLERAAGDIERLRDALAFIAGQEQYTFAECSLAEKIIGRAKAALER